MVVRSARSGDIHRLLEVHASAFPDPRGIEARRRNFEKNALGDLTDLRVVEQDGQIVAHAFLFRLEVWIGGRGVAAGGVASVGVAPEARGRGVASHLLEALHAESEARGDALTLLYPFRQGFYARFGYAPVAPLRRILFTPRSVPRAWSSIAGVHVRAANGHDRAAIEAVYQQVAPTRTGWITRPARMWDRILLDERRRWFVAAREGAVVGFASFTLTQAEPHAATMLTVHELTAVDDEARCALVGLVGAQRDQVAEVTLEVDAHDPIDRALLDADGARYGTSDVEHPLGQIVAGPMVRLNHPVRALEARGWSDPAVITLDIDHVRWALESGSMRPETGACDLTLDRAALAAIAFGGLRPSDAARIGWLRARDASSLARADVIFALPPYFAIDPF